ncbi:MAG: ATP-binding cassette domain-containing protein [Bacteroidales bacterium]|nr:ATP-binding cassette domain-containing protein [Bacteroidales bacterium]
MLELKNIYAGYRKDHWILEGIDLHIAEGETLGIIGKNGSGKSTLAKAILNMAPYRSGQIAFEDTDISRLAAPEITMAGIGFFMQGGQVFPNLTTMDNLVFAGRDRQKHALKQRLGQIKEYIGFLRQQDKLSLKASYLSGGEKHQLALAMVLMQKPRFIILDEPSAGLSISNVKMLYQTLSIICRAESLTLMLIEQNLPMVFDFAERIIRLRDHKAETVDTTKEKEIMMNEFIMN